jgi:acetylornithine deacetylase/succinyl-diaminopimelate desuccinylase-like protein
MAELNEKRLNSYIRSARKPFETMLRRLVEIPSVSADAAHGKDVEAAATLASGMLKEAGARVKRLKTPGHPLVIGRLGEDLAHPTVLLYNHLDVQPAENEGWESDPFELAVKKGRYIGRGTTDDKGPALTAFLAAQHARAVGIPLNFCFVWEFEEEMGSPHFDKAIRSEKEFLQTDSILVSDTVWISRSKPAIPFGIRGLLTATLSIETGSRDAHSGLVGGAARNPLGELCRLISQCHNAATGEVKIPGFYDGILIPGQEEIDGFLESGFTIAGFKKAHGLKRLRFSETDAVLEAIWSRPTFEVHGLSGGYTGEGVKTIVPPQAEAKVSMRLVPRQEPKKIFARLRDFCKAQNGDVKVTLEAMLDPYLASAKGEHMQAAAEAMVFGFQTKPALVREGGSIGAVVSLNRMFNAPVVFLGLSLPEHGYHAPNEYFEWRQVQGGIRTFVFYFDRISRIRPLG